MINSQSKKMTKTILFVACILCINIDIDGNGVNDFMVFDSDQNAFNLISFGVDNLVGANVVISTAHGQFPMDVVTLGAPNDVIGAGNAFNNTQDQL